MFVVIFNQLNKKLFICYYNKYYLLIKSNNKYRTGGIFIKNN